MDLIMNAVKKIQSFFSRKHDFTPIFVKQAEYIRKASEKLMQMVETTDPAEWKRLEKEIKLYERQGDAALQEFHEELYNSFLSSMTKTDLQALAMSIDDFLDKINDCAKTIILYSPKKFSVQMIDLTSYITTSSQALSELLPYASDMRSNVVKIILQCDRITEMEHASDESFEDYIAELFESETNAIELVRYKNVAEVFEDASDKAKAVSDTIRKLIMRYISK